MKTKQISLLIILFSLFASIIEAQSDEQIDKILNKHFQKQDFEKCELTARKYKIKSPSSKVPYYYLSQIELHHYYAIENLPNKKQWKYLNSASIYAKRIANHYPEWKDEITQAYLSYISSWRKAKDEEEHLRSVAESYSKHFNDTLSVYHRLFKEPVSHKEENETADNTSRKEIIQYASQLIGSPYKYSGITPETGFDCSGFVMYVFKNFGIELPHSSQMQSEIEGETLSLEEAMPGDLVFFGKKNGNKWKTQHSGIFYGKENGHPRFIHCSSRRGVVIDGNNASWNSYWKGLVLFVKRLPELE